MKERTKRILLIAVVLLIMAVVIWGSFLLTRWIWRHFTALNPEIAAGLVAAFATVLGAAITIALGRIFEKKKEVEAHFREKKSGIYDSFLNQFFTLYHSQGENIDLVPFLREWQRQIILWGGSRVLTSYLKWMSHLKKGTINAQSLFLMDDFFRAFRRDLGLSNWGLERGAFIRLILKHADLFFLMARENPNVTLDEVTKREKELGLEP